MTLPDEELLFALVGIPSVTGQEAEAVAFLQEQARLAGFEVQTDAAGNFRAQAGAGGPDAALVWLVGHIDTVAGHIPVRLGLGEAGPELWGRGAVDAKGSLAAFFCAARRHLHNPGLRILVAGCVDEEGSSAGAKALPRDATPDAILIGEPSGWDGITIGYKGILRGEYRLRRSVRHGGHPGPSAADELVGWWSAVQRELGFSDGFATCSGHLDSLESWTDGLQQEAVAHFQVRLPPDCPPAQAMGVLERLAGAASIGFSESMPAAESDPRSHLVAHLRGAIRAQGGVPHVKRKTGTADFNHLAGWHPGVPIVAYGPGDSSLDHTPEERLPLQEFRRAVDVLDQVLQGLARAAALGTQQAAARPQDP